MKLKHIKRFLIRGLWLESRSNLDLSKRIHWRLDLSLIFALKLSNCFYSNSFHFYFYFQGQSSMDRCGKMRIGMDLDLDLPSRLVLPPWCCPVALPGVCFLQIPAVICAGRTEGFLVPAQSLHPLPPHTTNPASTDLDLSPPIRPSNKHVKFSSHGRETPSCDVKLYRQIMTFVHDVWQQGRCFVLLN